MVWEPERTPPMEPSVSPLSTPTGPTITNTAPNSLWVVPVLLTLGTRRSRSVPSTLHRLDVGYQTDPWIFLGYALGKLAWLGVLRDDEQQGHTVTHLYRFGRSYGQRCALLCLHESRTSPR